VSLKEHLYRYGYSKTDAKAISEAYARGEDMTKVIAEWDDEEKDYTGELQEVIAGWENLNANQV